MANNTLVILCPLHVACFSFYLLFFFFWNFLRSFILVLILSGFFLHTYFKGKITEKGKRERKKILHPLVDSANGYKRIFRIFGDHKRKLFFPWSLEKVKISGSLRVWWGAVGSHRSERALQAEMKHLSSRLSGEGGASRDYLWGCCVSLTIQYVERIRLIG